MPTRSASAEWSGAPVGGSGRMRLGSGAYEGEYSFPSRFEDAVGTNPEELLGAAHAGCFSMFLGKLLADAGRPAVSIQTEADVQLVKSDAGYSITQIDLRTFGHVPGISADDFSRQAETAKVDCPVSRALAGVEITLQASLANS
ncbi:MAG: OsmC family protein [Micromonosporaceae bacterium]